MPTAPTALVELLSAVMVVASALLAGGALTVRAVRLRRITRRDAAQRRAMPLILRALSAEAESDPDPDPADAGAGADAGSRPTGPGVVPLPREVSRGFAELAVSLAPKLRGADRAALTELLRQRGVVAEAALATRSRGAVRRLRAVELLGALGSPDCLPELTARLADRSGDVRRAAVRALGRTGRPEAVPALLALLDRAERTVPRGGVTLALLRLGPIAVPELVAAVGAGSPDARRAAAQVLGWLGAAGAAPALEAGLDDADPHVRVACVEALGRVGSPSAAALLRDRLRPTRPAAERLAAAQALGRLADPESVEALGAVLTDRHPVAIAAAEALTQLGPAGLAVLRERADEVPEAREWCAALALRPPVRGDAALEPVGGGP